MKSKKFEIDEVVEKYFDMYERGMICDVRVGTDSQLHSTQVKRNHKFVTVVLLHYNSSSMRFQGGDEKISILWDRRIWIPGMHVNGIMHKMVEETMKTIEMAEELAQYIDKDSIILELDINSKTHEASNVALEACKGMCAGYGYENVTWKPDALITYAADNLCKGKTFRKRKHRKFGRNGEDFE